MDEPRRRQVDLALVDALDHLLDRGVVISGEAMISVGGVDLLYLGLNVLLANVDTLIRSQKSEGARGRVGEGAKVP